KVKRKWDVDTRRNGAKNFMSNIPNAPKKGIFRGRRGDPQKCQKCGARTRRGTPCQLPAERNPYTGRRSRCRLHGGLSSGPQTPEGRGRVGAAHFRHGRRSKAYREQQRTLRTRLGALKTQAKGTSK